MQVWIWSVSASKDQDFSHLIVTISAKPTPPKPLTSKTRKEREKRETKERKKKKEGSWSLWCILHSQDWIFCIFDHLLRYVVYIFRFFLRL